MCQVCDGIGLGKIPWKEIDQTWSVHGWHEHESWELFKPTSYIYINWKWFRWTNILILPEPTVQLEMHILVKLYKMPEMYHGALKWPFICVCMTSSCILSREMHGPHQLHLHLYNLSDPPPDRWADPGHTEVRHVCCRWIIYDQRLHCKKAFLRK